MSQWLKDDGRPDFALLFSEARPQLLAIARRVVRNEADAEDVLQQAFLNAIKHSDRFEGRAQATSWMHRIVYNTGLMHLRSRRRKGAESLDALPPEVSESIIKRGSHASAPDTPDVFLERGALSSVLKLAMGSLNEVDQKIVHMRLYEERSTSDVAKALKLSVAATKTRLHRARHALQRVLVDVAPELREA